jgi:hypothetical protein
LPPTDSTTTIIMDQLTRALGEAVIRSWSNLPQEVQDHLFKEAVASQGESIRSQLAVFLHDNHWHDKSDKAVLATPRVKYAAK